MSFFFSLLGLTWSFFYFNLFPHSLLSLLTNLNIFFLNRKLEEGTTSMLNEAMWTSIALMTQNKLHLLPWENLSLSLVRVMITIVTGRSSSRCTTTVTSWCVIRQRLLDMTKSQALHIIYHCVDLQWICTTNEFDIFGCNVSATQ